MKILYMDWKSYCTEDMIPALEDAGCQVVRVPFTKELGWKGEEYADMLRMLIKEVCPDFVYSFNFYPLVSNVCEEKKCRYVSWVYDSPQVALCNDAAKNKCNMIFLFDEEQTSYFRSKEVDNVKYLPMASDPKRVQEMIAGLDQREKYASEVSFVGSLYTEKKHRLFDRLDGVDQYTKGYLDALVEAQQRVYGVNFIEEALTDKVLEEMTRVFPMDPHEDGSETPSWLYAEYVINRHVTAREREEMLKELSYSHDVSLYTNDSTWSAGKIKNRGPIDYYDEAPYVYASSDINLNITLRSIKSGIPLRAFDIMGAGGFLLTSYTSDFLKFFTPDIDFVFYESKQDLMDKADYYLLHSDERKRIAENGYEKICRDHTYQCRVQEILKYAGLS